MKKFKRLSHTRGVARRPSFLRSSTLRRSLAVEPLEARSLMAAGVFASQYFNARMPADVDNNGEVQITDALAVITSLRQGGVRTLASGEGEGSVTTTASAPVYYDVNNDSQLNITDVLEVISDLRSAAPPAKVHWNIVPVAVGTPINVSTAVTPLSRIDKGQDFQLFVYATDLRARSATVVNGGLENPRLNINLDATKAQATFSETQYLILRGTPTSGTTFRIMFDGALSDPITYTTLAGDSTKPSSAMATAIRNALQNHPSIGTGNVSVSLSNTTPANPLVSTSPTNPIDQFRWKITFTGLLSDTDVPKLVGDTSTLPGVTAVVDDGNTIDFQGNPVTGVGFQGSAPSGASGDQVDQATFLFGGYNGIGGFTNSITDPVNFPTKETATQIQEVGAISFLNTAVAGPLDEKYPDPAGPGGTPWDDGSGVSFPESLVMRIQVRAVAVGSGGSTSLQVSGASTNNFALNLLKFWEPGNAPRETIAFDEQTFANAVTVAIDQYVDAVNDSSASGPGLAATGSTELAIPLTRLTGNDSKFGTVSTVQFYGAGFAPTAATGAAFASRSLRTANGGTLRFDNPDAKGNPTAASTTVFYTAPVGFGGTDTFLYTTQDTAVHSSATVAAYRDTATVTIDVTQAAFTAVPDNLTVNESDAGYNLDVLANDTSGPNGPINVINPLPLAAHGTLSIVAGGVKGTTQLHYTPTDVNYFGPDTFTYTVADSASPTANVKTATVNLTISNVNDPPIVFDKNVDIDQDTDPVNTPANHIDALAGNNAGPNETEAISLFSVGAPAVAGSTATVGTGADLGKIIYKPKTGYSGPDSFSYTIRDAGNPNLSTTRTIFITVIPTARPQAVDDPNLSFNEANGATSGPSSYTLNVAANDRVHDPQGTTFVDIISITNVSLGILPGELAINPATGSNDTIVFTPAVGNEDFFGTFSFDYTITDTSGLPADPGNDPTGHVVVTINNVNDPPSGPTLGVTVGEDSGANTINVAQGASVGPANEIPLDSFVVSAIVQQGTKGTVTLDVGGNVKYTPNNNAFGTGAFGDTFIVTLRDRSLNDPLGLTFNRTITVDITPQDDLAVAGTGAMTVAEDSDGLQLPLPNANQIDVTTIPGTNPGPFEAGPPADDHVHLVSATVNNISIITPVVNQNYSPGTVSIAGNVITFVPSPDFIGTAVITYTITDDAGPTGRLVNGTINVNVTPGNNDLPFANAGAFSTPEDPPTPASFNIFSIASAGPFEDATDPITVQFQNFSNGNYTVGGVPRLGSATFSNGFIRYTPAPDFFGTETFQYQVTDSANQTTGFKTITVTVTPVNDLPHAVNNVLPPILEDAGRTSTPVNLDVLANDDVGAANETTDVLTITTVTQGQNGVVAITGGGKFVTYVPNADFYGTDSFTYTINDGNVGGNATATVNINITEVNDNPTTTPHNETVLKFLGKQEILLLGGVKGTPPVTFAPNVFVGPDDAAHTNVPALVPTETLSITGVGTTDGALIATGSGGGTITLENGKVFYTPPVTTPNPAVDVFQYTASDSRTGKSLGTVTITIQDFVPVVVRGSVFLDSSGDGVRQVAETTGYGGVTITLVPTGPNAVNRMDTLTTTTRADGTYEFPFVIPGDYDIVESQPRFVTDSIETPSGAVDAEGLPIATLARTPGGQLINDHIHIHLPITGVLGGLNDNYFAERGLDASSILASNKLYGGPTGNVFIRETSTLGSHEGFLFYMNAPTAGSPTYTSAFTQVLNGWSNVASVEATLSADLSQLTLKVTYVGGATSNAIIPTNSPTSPFDFYVLGVDANGGLLIRMNIKPTSPYFASGEGYVAAADSVFGEW